MSRNHLALLCLSLLLTIVGCKKDDDLVPNKVPAVDAGSAKTITLPDSVVLAGSASDTDGHVVAYLWSEVSGPAVATIINPGSQSTVVKFNTKGTYVFQLMATDDKGATGVDTVSVTVTPGTIKALTLQPANNPNEFNVTYYNGNDASAVGSVDIPVEAWTINGNPITIRNLMKFDLSSLTSNATIVSATLYLYSYPNPTMNGNLSDANFGTNNTLLVQQVVANWSPSTTTWFNQPATTIVNQVTAPSTTSPQLDFSLDVTAQVASMVNNNANYGFMLKLQNENTYTSRIFVSSHNSTYTTKYPKLVVTYQYK